MRRPQRLMPGEADQYSSCHIPPAVVQRMNEGLAQALNFAVFDIKYLAARDRKEAAAEGKEPLPTSFWLDRVLYALSPMMRVSGGGYAEG